MPWVQYLALAELLTLYCLGKQPEVMPIHGYTVLCTMPILDHFSARLSCIGLVDMVSVLPWQIPEDATPEVRDKFKDVKFALPSTVCCTQWFGQEGEQDLEFIQRLAILAPDGKVTPIEGESHFRFVAPFHRIAHVIPAIGLRLLGPHAINVYLHRVGEEEIAGNRMPDASCFFLVAAATIPSSEAAASEPGGERAAESTAELAVPR
jgi:hypothetical protein